MRTSEPTPDDPGDVDEPLNPVTNRSQEGVLSRAKVVARRIAERFRKVSGDPTERPALPPDTETNPPVT